ncbi:MAG: rod shape-determining protein MreC [Deltaproteobacteria bacterium]|nr:rod shape-determining protein MreC [Deltaproteobacteria bacterium]
MLDFLKKNRLRISVVLIFISLFFVLIVQIDNERKENWLSLFVQNLSYPFVASSSFITRQVSDYWTHYVYLIGVKQENDQLKERLKNLSEINQKNYEYIIAYQRLQRSLEFQNTNPDEKVFAEIIGEIKKGFSKLIVINKGYQHGIRRNFAVLSHEGIVGKIQSVTTFQSVVQLINDSHSQFPVLIQRTRTKAMLHGTYDGNLVVENIPRTLELKHEDRIVTSGLAGIFPKGFPIGFVSRIDKKDFGLFQSVVLTPAVDFNKLEEVVVILSSKSNIHKPLFTD